MLTKKTMLLYTWSILIEGLLKYLNAGVSIKFEVGSRFE